MPVGLILPVLCTYDFVGGSLLLPSGIFNAYCAQISLAVQEGSR
jgi:hypothetical protein